MTVYSESQPSILAHMTVHFGSNDRPLLNRPSTFAGPFTLVHLGRPLWTSLILVCYFELSSEDHFDVQLTQITNQPIMTQKVPFLTDRVLIGYVL